MKYANILAHLASTDEGKALVAEFTSLVNENTTAKEALEKAETKVASLGDRDVGALIAKDDWLTANGLDTPEKLADYKAKSDGLEQTIEEQKTSAAEIALNLEQGSQKIKKDADRVRLDAKVRIALSDKIGDKGGFNLVIDNKMGKGLFAEDEAGNILYGVEGQRKPLEDSFEEMRNEAPYAFTAKPSGTNNIPQHQNNQQQQQNTPLKSSFGDVVAEMTK